MGSNTVAEPVHVPLLTTTPRGPANAAVSKPQTDPSTRENESSRVQYQGATRTHAGVNFSLRLRVQQKISEFKHRNITYRDFLAPKAMKKSANVDLTFKTN